MPKIRAQVRLHHLSGLDEDDAVNVFHFVGDATAAIANEITGNLDAFYTAIQGMLAESFDGTAEVRYYNIDVLPSGPPFATGVFSFTPSNLPALPAEVALCLSFQAAQVPGLDQRHRRGRVFIGPLSTDVMANEVPQRPAGAYLTLLANAAATLEDDSIASAAPWHVYSSTLTTSAPVTNGWVDNAFDTQRRRGEAASARVTWS